MRVAFFGSSEASFSNRHFAALREAPCTVVAAVDVPAARRVSTAAAAPGQGGFAALARSAGIPVLEPETPNRSEFVSALAALKPDLFLAAGYLGILKEEVLAVPRLLAVNFHASLLPAYRGRHPLFWALRNNERLVGMTVHVMERGLDTGDILYQAAVRTRQDDSVTTLYDRIMARSLPLVGRLIVDLSAGRLRRRPQGEARASYYPAVRPDDFRLEWSWPARRLQRWIQTTPGQCCAELCGRRVFLLDAAVVQRAERGPVRAAADEQESRQETAAPGALLRADARGCLVATGDVPLRLRRIRPEDEPEQDCAAWIRSRSCH